MIDSRNQKSGIERHSLFSVRNIDNAILVFCFTSIISAIIVFLVFYQKNCDFLNSLILTCNQITEITTFAIFVILLTEGIGIMFIRYRMFMDERNRKLKEAEQKGYEQGLKEKEAELEQAKSTIRKLKKNKSKKKKKSG